MAESVAKTDSAGLIPFVPPSYTIKELLNAIPSHCYERSTFISSLYLAANMVLVIAFAYAAIFIPQLCKSDSILLSRVPSEYLSYATTALNWTLWNTYWLWQGFAATGIWVIAHECGHQSYSEYQAVNYSVGWVLHSALLVPFHSWRITHAQHHAATGHMTRDQVFVPRTRSNLNLPSIKELAGTENAIDDGVLYGTNVPPSMQDRLHELLEDAPLATLIGVVLQQILGWPLYLFSNASGQFHYPTGTNHFNPKSFMFDKRHRRQIVASDIGLIIALASLSYWTYSRGILEVIKFYGIPYLYVNNWLVMITFLQHTDPMLPHYRDSGSGNGWNFQRGALCTVDRNMFGFVGPYILHGICETHLAHHLSSKIPHYNAWAATEALKQYLGQNYCQSNENMLISLYKSFSSCKFVEDEGDVVFFKNARGLAKRYPVFVTPPSDSGLEFTS